MPRRYVGPLIGFLVALRTLAVVPVLAAEFTVDVTADSDDASPGDGNCRAASGLCTLRAAVQEANALPGDDVIKLRTGTYILQDDQTSPPFTRGDLDVTENLTIQPLTGTPVIDGKNLSRIFEVTRSNPDVPVTLTLQGLSLTGGNATSEFTSQPACGLEGGAVCAVNAGVRIQSCELKSHRGDNGGAVFVNGGDLEIVSSTLSGNVATSLGGAVAAQGSTVSISKTTIADNKIDAGGSFGGGIAVYAGTSLDLEQSTLSGNTAVGTGGGLEITGAGDVVIRNCTFGTNTASAGSGGGIDYRSADSFLLSNTTIARNSGGGLQLEVATGATVRNSLLVLNLPQDCTGSAAISANNLLSTATSCGLTGPAPDADPKLSGTLDANGNPNGTKTYALLDKSPADGVGADCEPVDQRGFSRDSACDLGAYERLADQDEDLVPDGGDNCPTVANPDQTDSDNDGIGDACDCTPKSATLGPPDADDDGDGIPNRNDCCADTSSLSEPVGCLGAGLNVGTDGCSIAQACDCDARIVDGTAYPWGKRRGWKQCVKKAVRKLKGVDKHCKRDVRRAIFDDPNLSSCGIYTPPSDVQDRDGDGVVDSADNCKRTYNPTQLDTDGDGRGDACDDDDDNDNLKDSEDKCPTVLSCDNDDADSDGVGNECDECPWENNGGPVDAQGCEKGQEGKGAVAPPDKCTSKPPKNGDGDGELIDE